jgi:tRNA G18 (ribose-2'-O)-methylase SpoU
MLASVIASTTTSPAGDRVNPAVASEPFIPVRLPIGAGAGRAQTSAELRQAKPDRIAFQARTRLPVRVILDGVRHGYNVGALFRLCDAFLCERLVICGRDASRGTRRLIQAAQGTHKWVPWEQRESAGDAVRAARAEGWFVLAVEQTSDAVSLEHLAPRFPICVVLGSERAGVSQSVLDLADAAVSVPMSGMANSLNVATAAAIVLHRLATSHAEP